MSPASSLWVPGKTFPSATTGFPFELEPICAFHLMFVPVLGSQVAGRPFIVDAMLRRAVPPHGAQSWEAMANEAAPEIRRNSVSLCLARLCNRHRGDSSAPKST